MLAVAASAGLWMLLLGQVQGWWLPDEVTFRGEPLHAVDRPHYLAIVLLLLTITLFVTAAIASIHHSNWSKASWLNHKTS